MVLMLWVGNFKHSSCSMHRSRTVVSIRVCALGQGFSTNLKLAVWLS